ncbi:MAG: Flp family type IVb pilin [Candidatus Eisenbacteria bacterium]
MLTVLKKFHRNDEGQDIIEYALLAAFISIAAIATIKLIGPVVLGIYDDIHTALTT